MFIPSGNHASGVVKTYGELGMRTAGIKLIGPMDVVPDTKLQDMGDAAIGTIVMGHYAADLDNAANKDFVKAFHDAYGPNAYPDFMTAAAWDSMHAIFDTIKKLDGKLDDGEKVMAALKGWSVEVLSLDSSDLGGVNLVTILINGDTAWSRLKFEGGTHRVQRVPATESQGRIHTSSATVLVLPEAEEVEIEIDERDLEIDVYRSSGPGGQGVNTTDSAYASPTGRPASSLQCRTNSQQNWAGRAGAGSIAEVASGRTGQAKSAERRSQVGGGGRREDSHARTATDRGSAAIYRSRRCSPATSTMSSTRLHPMSVPANSLR